jgi:hypothetical protein
MVYVVGGLISAPGGIDMVRSFASGIANVARVIAGPIVGCRTGNLPMGGDRKRLKRSSSRSVSGEECMHIVARYIVFCCLSAVVKRPRNVELAPRKSREKKAVRLLTSEEIDAAHISHHSHKHPHSNPTALKNKRDRTTWHHSPPTRLERGVGGI